MLDKLVTTLIYMLEEQARFYKTLLNFAIDKQPILVKGDIEALDKITSLEEDIIIQLGQKEEQRAKVQKALALDLGVPADKITIEMLKDRVEPELGAKLVAVAEHMTGTLKELKDKNDANNQMIKQSLDFIDYTVNVVTSLEEERPSYPQKEGKGKDRPRIFDQKV